jgi:hypothetical protein
MFKGQKIYPVCYRIYLNLKFEDHVRAKTYNCLWDSRINRWYFHEDEYMKSGIKTDILLHNELCPYMILNDTVQFV